MTWIIGILTVILVLNSLLLVLLILIQLPKKEAGMGTAFGGGTTDALFGAGTGNALTKLTKYCSVVFFTLTLSLSILNAQRSKADANQLEEAMQAASAEQQSQNAAAADPLSALPASTNTAANNLLTTGTNALPETSAPQTEAPNADSPEPAPADNPSTPPQP